MNNQNNTNWFNDQVIAWDLLLSAKTGVRNLAYAITETSTPEVRNTLVKQLNDAINFQEKVANFMVSKNYYPTGDISNIINTDITNAEKAISMNA